MKFPTTPSTSGIGTTGAAGCVILAGVIWSQISPWWMILSVLLIISGIGQENKRQ